jgi:hypothetical protein
MIAAAKAPQSILAGFRKVFDFLQVMVAPFLRFVLYMLRKSVSVSAT